MDITEALGIIKESSAEAFDVISGKITDLNEESKSRRQENSELKTFKNGLIENFELDSTQDLSTQINQKLQTSKNESQQNLTDFQILSGKFDELSNKFEQKEKEANESRKTAILSRRDNELTTALSESNIDPKMMPFVKSTLKENIAVKDDGSFSFSDGDNTFNSIGEGVSKFIEARPDLQQMSNAGGSGEENLNNQNKKPNVVSRAAFGDNIEAIAAGEITVNE